MSLPERSLGLPLGARARAPAPGESSLWQALAREFVRPRSPQIVVIVLALWIAVAANWRLWSELARLGGAPSLYVPSMVAMGFVVLPGTVALLTLTAWSRGMKPVWLAVLGVSAPVQMAREAEVV